MSEALASALVWVFVIGISLSSLAIGVVRNSNTNEKNLFKGHIFVWYVIAFGLFASSMWLGFALPFNTSGVVATNYVTGGLGMLGMMISLAFAIVSSVNFINVVARRNRSL